MTACSRLAFAMSRDSRFPAHRLMRRVNRRTHTPIPATLMTFVVGVVLMVALPGSALLKLIVASTILPAIIYSATIVPDLAVVGLVAAGGLFLLSLLIFHPETLETEPVSQALDPHR